MIISAGPTNSSLPRGCSPGLRPGGGRANPDEETTDWRAVCGRTARTVRRAGTAKAVSDPYRMGCYRTSEACILRKAPDVIPGEFTFWIEQMSILVVGTVAFDSIETPFGSAEGILGGWGALFALAGRFFPP